MVKVYFRVSGLCNDPQRIRGLKDQGTENAWDPTHQLPQVAAKLANKRHTAFFLPRHSLWHPELRHFNTCRLQQSQRDRVRVGLRQVEAEGQEDRLQLRRETQDVYCNMAALDLSAPSLKTL